MAKSSRRKALKVLDWFSVSSTQEDNIFYRALVGEAFSLDCRGKDAALTGVEDYRGEDAAPTEWEILKYGVGKASL